MIYMEQQARFAVKSKEDLVCIEEVHVQIKTVSQTVKLGVQIIFEGRKIHKEVV